MQSVACFFYLRTRVRCCKVLVILWLSLTIPSMQYPSSNKYRYKDNIWHIQHCRTYFGKPMNVHSNAGLLEANSASARCWATKSMWENHQKLMMRRAIHHLGVSENCNIPPVIAAKNRGKFNHEPRILWVHLIFRQAPIFEAFHKSMVY